MHRSRVSTILIDTPDAEAATAFWSGALGAPAKPAPGEEHFTVLEDALPGFTIVVQRIDDGVPRIHLDMETDDVDAETARLIALGAAEVGRWLECRTLRAPGGHIVCVIPVHSDRAEFEAAATIWR